MTVKLQKIIGLPPDSHISQKALKNSMPVVEIRPLKPKIVSSISGFELVPATSDYEEQVKKLGYQVSLPLRLAFLADSFPTDSFTNEYGESFLQKITDIASTGMLDLAQMTGQSTGLGAAKALADAMAGMKGEGVLAGGFKTVGSGISQAMGASQDFIKANEGSALGGMLSMVNKALTGRINFSNVWKNATYVPSYTMTIRLYNPNPGSKEATDKYIVGPIAAILALTIPQSDGGASYSWPFFQAIKAPGLYNLEQAMITNVTVIKGGDQQQISFAQSLGIVDIRLDVGSLFNTMILNTGDKLELNRPTVEKYLKAMKDSRNDEVEDYHQDPGVTTGNSSPIKQNRNLIDSGSQGFKALGGRKQGDYNSTPSSRTSNSGRNLKDILVGRLEDFYPFNN